MTEQPLPLVEVREKALETAFHLIIARGYGGSETKALAALKRRCPGRTKDECLKILKRSVLAFGDIIEFLQENEAAAYASYSKETKHHDLLSIAGPIIEEYSEFPREKLRWVLDVVFLNYHLR